MCPLSALVRQTCAGALLKSGLAFVQLHMASNCTAAAQLQHRMHFCGGLGETIQTLIALGGLHVVIAKMEHGHHQDSRELHHVWTAGHSLS